MADVVSPNVDRGSGVELERTSRRGFAQASLLPGPEVHVLPENGSSDCFDYLFEPGQRASAIITEDVQKVLAKMPDAVFQTCVTSPPYWSLRDYGSPDQIGLEGSVYAYIDSLVAAFNDVRRVIRDDGTMWLNIGDSFTSGNRT